MTTLQKKALQVSAVLWMLWGLVHLLAGVLTVSQETAAAVAGIADAVDPALLKELSYHEAAGAIIKQHGWNLGWIGVTTIVGSVFVWRGNTTAIWVTALVGGMADIGYFVFIDVPGHANFVPGTVMTIFSGTAIVLSVWSALSQRASSEEPHS